MAALSLVMFLASLAVLAYAIVQCFKGIASLRKNKDLAKSRFKRGGISIVISAALLIAMSLITVEPTSEQKIDALKATAAPVKASETPAAVETPEPTQAPVIPVFYVDLSKDFGSYEGKIVEMTVPVKEVNTSGRFTVRDRIKSELRIETNDESLYKKKNDIAFATVCGMAEVKYGYASITNAEVLWYGTEAPSDYVALVSEYEAAVRAAKVKAREDFIASAVEVSYDDLRRYPDTYKGKAMKLYLYVDNVEADGLLTVGNIFATYNGGEIGVHDKRELREPRLMAGDYITVYATGAGLSTVKVYAKGTGILGSDIGADVKEKYEIPLVEMIYTDKDNVDMFSASETASEDFYYNKGAEFADKLNSMLG